MWTVLEATAASKALDRMPKGIVRKWNAWVAIVRQSGPEGLRLIKGYHDEALSGKWRGHRSSRLGDRERIIYQVRRQVLEVEVIEITGQHDYRKR
jgi:proteic killer suppression protein